jgi:outer membrane beta-barrel protein
MGMKKLNLILVLLFLASPLVARAQESNDNDLDIIEMELDKPANDAARTAPRPMAAPADSKANPTATGPTVGEKAEAPSPQDDLKDFSGLGRLAPFTEVSVIQKKYQPKTGRFQFFIGPTLITNDPFFNTYGGVAKLGYFLTENWGLEANYFALSTSERDSTKELKRVNNVNTVNLVYPKSYMGLDLTYTPIYGKMTWFNKKIVPFDLYFAAGYGSTTTAANENAGTVHFAAGQIFAITKGMSFRWDFSYNVFSATGIDGSKGSFNNLFLTVGMSFFFPEASYR